LYCNFNPTQNKRRTIMKPTIRANTFSKRVWILVVLAAVAAATLAMRPASAQAGEEDKSPVGSWRTTATVTSLQGIPPFPVLMTFQADGTMSQSRLYYLPAFGVMTTSFHGAWKRIDGNQIATTSFSLAQGAPGNAALNGAFFGTEKVDFQPVMGSDGNSFTAQWTSTVFDPNGNQIMQNTGALSGVRIHVEP
jgi:hypothetical protein